MYRIRIHPWHFGSERTAKRRSHTTNHRFRTMIETETYGPKLEYPVPSLYAPNTDLYRYLSELELRPSYTLSKNLY
jgi:hypothetical protein